MNDTALVLRNDKGNVTGFVVYDPKSGNVELTSVYGESIAFSVDHYAAIGEFLAGARGEAQPPTPQPGVPRGVARTLKFALIERRERSEQAMYIGRGLKEAELQRIDDAINWLGSLSVQDGNE